MTRESAEGTPIRVVGDLNRYGYESYNRVYGTDGASPAIRTGTGGGLMPRIREESESNGLRIRYLTERECWRLMGFSDDDFDRARDAGTSRTQLYRQAGNSIVVPVLEAIFRGMYIDQTWERVRTLDDFGEAARWPSSPPTGSGS